MFNFSSTQILVAGTFLYRQVGSGRSGETPRESCQGKKSFDRDGDASQNSSVIKKDISNHGKFVLSFSKHVESSGKSSSQRISPSEKSTERSTAGNFGSFRAGSEKDDRKNLSKNGIYHRVEKGQTLWRIARAYGVSVEELMKANGLKDPRDLKAGDLIFVPGATHQVYVEPYKKESTAPDFAWPLNGPITSYFGKRGKRFHKGIDIDGKKGDIIRAAADGKVVFSGYMRGYGKVIVIKHNDDFSTVYAHNSVNLVKKGDYVKKGQPIARVGSTGRATGSHLHFEVRYRGKAVDPMDYLPPRKVAFRKR